MTLFRQLMLKDKKMERKIKVNLEIRCKALFSLKSISCALIVGANREILHTCAARSQLYYTKKHTPFVLNIDISLRFTA